MQKVLLTIATLAMLAAVGCQSKQENKENAKENTQKEASVSSKQNSPSEQKAPDSEAVDTPQPNYQKMLLGRWELKEDNNFWKYYDKDKVYSDGNESGTPYKVEKNTIVYDKDSKVRILSINEKEMTIETNGTKQTWVKADNPQQTEQKTEQKKPTQPLRINPKQLIGLWDREGGDEFSSIRFKADGYYDAVPFNDFYTYQVKGNKIYYKKTANTPPQSADNATDEIVRLDDKVLILKRGGDNVKFIRSKYK